MSPRVKVAICSGSLAAAISNVGDATLLIGRAVLALGRDATRAAVRDYIEGVGTRSDSVRGVAGAIAFDARHDVVGRQVVIAEVPAARAAVAVGARP